MLLNPLLAWLGVLAVGVPILIHLLNRRKFERVVWAAMRFLRVSVEQNQRRIRIEDMLLLALMRSGAAGKARALLDLSRARRRRRGTLPAARGRRAAHARAHACAR